MRVWSCQRTKDRMKMNIKRIEDRNVVILYYTEHKGVILCV